MECHLTVLHVALCHLQPALYPLDYFVFIKRTAFNQRAADPLDAQLPPNDATYTRHQSACRLRVAFTHGCTVDIYRRSLSTSQPLRRHAGFGVYLEDQTAILEPRTRQRTVHRTCRTSEGVRFHRSADIQLLNAGHC